ncbi:MAG: phenylalanine--tRNA ligase subunit beta [Candidatus Thorarchaeota archaeon]|nr:phenylalanine--tRNA ligase subunit beta [Candidatus Thorarchaeota archaeon]
MIVGCLVDQLMMLIGKKMTTKKLEDTLFLLKAEVEKLEGNEIEIEINPDRQDMLSAEGIARAVRAFLGIQKGLREFPVKKSGKSVIVGKGLEKIRKYIACGIVKGVEINEDLLIQYMHLQESLTSTHGRNRSKASIGLYVHDDLKYPVRYYPEKPEKIVFAPLGYEDEMDGPTILEKHEKGVDYGPIIAHHKMWPLLADSDGKVLSLPPVINSNTLGKLTTETSNIFVEVTGTHLPTVNQALNIMVTSLAERGGTIESLTVQYPDESKFTTPDLKPKVMKISTNEVSALLGLDLSESEIVDCLEKMCYGAKISSNGKIAVQVPQYRTDVLHVVDIIEDVAIGYGFDKIVPTMPSTMTAGKLRPLTRLKNKARDLMVGVGYQEVLSYIMTSPETLNQKMLIDDPIVETGNPKSRDYSVLRNSLLPILLDFASQNQHVDLPQHIFEVGDVVSPDAKAETRTRQYSSVCGLSTDVRVNLTKLITEIGFVMRGMGLDGRFKYEGIENPSFIKGRCATILVDERPIGIFGEVSPKVLEKFQIGNPIIAFELSLPNDGQW